MKTKHLEPLLEDLKRCVKEHEEAHLASLTAQKRAADARLALNTAQNKLDNAIIEMIKEKKP